MIETQKVIDLLKAKMELLDRLKDQQLGGFAIIYPPNGNPIDTMLFTSTMDDRAFFDHIRSIWQQDLEKSGFGGTAPRIR